jgi:hypothetical protein
MAQGLQPGLFEQLDELQHCLARAQRIDTESQCFDEFLLGHPAWNAKPSLSELDFDILSTIESMESKDLKFLLMQGVKRIENRNFSRIAGIIAAGLSARLTNIGKFLSAARLSVSF